VGGQRRVACWTVRAVAAAPPERRERAGLIREQLASDRMKARQKRLSLPGPAASYSEDDGGSCRQTGVVPGGCSGRAALRREQCYIYEVSLDTRQ
jgi:hypothetical protein